VFSRSALTHVPVIYEADSRFTGKSSTSKALKILEKISFSYILTVI